MAAASTMPMSTETKPSTWGLTETSSPSESEGSTVNEAAATSTSETTAEVKKPRWIGDIHDRSPEVGLLAKMPTTEEMTPIAATTSGKTIPTAPKNTCPRISAATRVTA